MSSKVLTNVEGTVKKYHKVLLIVVGIIIIGFVLSKFLSGGSAASGSSSGAAGTSSTDNPAYDSALSNLQNGYNALANQVNQLTAAAGTGATTAAAALGTALNLNLSVSGSSTNSFGNSYNNNSTSGSSGFAGLKVGPFSFGGGGSKSSSNDTSVINTENTQGGYSQSLNYGETKLSSTDLGSTLAAFIGVVTKAQQNSATAAAGVTTPYYAVPGQQTTYTKGTGGNVTIGTSYTPGLAPPTG